MARNRGRPPTEDTGKDVTAFCWRITRTAARLGNTHDVKQCVQIAWSLRTHMLNGAKLP